MLTRPTRAYVNLILQVALPEKVQNCGGVLVYETADIPDSLNIAELFLRRFSLIVVGVKALLDWNFKGCLVELRVNGAKGDRGLIGVRKDDTLCENNSLLTSQRPLVSPHAEVLGHFSAYSSVNRAAGAH